MRTLRLLRHAKSDWSNGTLPDHDRPLNQRGRRSREVIADHVRGWPVALVVVSSATRARETAAPVIEALGCPARVEDRVYDATAGELLRLVCELPDTLGDVMFVGHNPGTEQLHELLCGDGPAYPTAALATLALDVGAWAEVWPGCGRQLEFVTPKGLVAVDPGS